MMLFMLFPLKSASKPCRIETEWARDPRQDEKQVVVR